MRVLFLTLLATVAYAADIPAGSHMLLRLQNSVSTSSTRPGDPIYFTAMTPISDGNAIVVPAGSYVQGVVVDVTRPGKVKGRAAMRIRLEPLTLPSGQQIQIRPRVASLDASSQRVVDEEGLIRQDSNVNCDVLHVGIFAGFGAGMFARNSSSVGKNVAIGAGAGGSVGTVASLLTRGRAAELLKGTDLDTIFDRPVDLQ